MCISFGFKLFKKTNHLVIRHYDGFVDDEEVLLYDINTSPNLDLPYDLNERFYFDGLDDDKCLSEFRFRKHDLPLLAEVRHVKHTNIPHSEQHCFNTSQRGYFIMLIYIHVNHTTFPLQVTIGFTKVYQQKLQRCLHLLNTSS